MLKMVEVLSREEKKIDLNKKNVEKLQRKMDDSKRQRKMDDSKKLNKEREKKT